MKIFVRGANLWREERDWPLPRASYVPYYLRKGPSGSLTSINDGALSTEKPPAGEQATTYSYPDWEWVNGVVAMDPNGRPDPVRRVLTFTSAPLERDLEVTGPIVLKLFASSSAIDTQFIVKLADQHPQDEAARKKGEQPGSTPASKGWLKASHREKDAARSTALRPFYTHTNPQPLKPGEVYEFEIEVLPMSYVFKKGHRIRLEIANSNSPLTDGIFSHPYHPTQIGERHDPPRRGACVVFAAAGGQQLVRRRPPPHSSPFQGEDDRAAMLRIIDRARLRRESSLPLKGGGSGWGSPSNYCG